MAVGLAALTLAGGAAIASVREGNSIETLPAPTEPIGRGELTASYFGTTTILFKTGDESLMVDGFFSRPGGPLRLALGRIQPDVERIKAAMSRGRVPAKLNAVLVGHTHHDHALDSAVVACDRNAVLVGSKSLQSIQKAQIASPSPCLDRFRLVEKEMAFGAFTVEAINTEHSPSFFAEGKIDQISMPAHFTQFKPDGTYSFLVKGGAARVLVSAGIPVNRSRLRGMHPNVVFLSIGGLRAHQKQHIEEYWDTVVVASGAPVVVPTHWDDFTTKLDNPLTVMPESFADLNAVMCQVINLAKRDNVVVHMLPPFAEFGVAGLTRTTQQNFDAARLCKSGVVW